MVMRKRVYIAAPITKGDLAHNLNRATEAFVRLAKAGLAPLCPQWSCYAKPVNAVGDGLVACQATVEGNHELVHSDWMGVDLPWVAVCDAVLRLPGESRGAEEEVRCARSLGIPIFFNVDELIAWNETCQK